MNVIIIAALGLLVLIILAVVLTGKFRIFTTATASCESFGGSCFSEFDERVDEKASILFCKEGYVTKRNTDCENDEYNEKICCIPMVKEE